MSIITESEHTRLYIIFEVYTVYFGKNRSMRKMPRLMMHQATTAEIIVARPWLEPHTPDTGTSGRHTVPMGWLRASLRSCRASGHLDVCRASRQAFVRWCVTVASN